MLTMDRPLCLRTAFALLLQAHEYATNLQCDAWEFAVEMHVLREAGLTNNDVRWLLMQDYLVHAWEVTTREQFHRVFQQQGGLLGEKSCFILTPAGLAFALHGEILPTDGSSQPAGGAPGGSPPRDGKCRP